MGMNLVVYGSLMRKRERRRAGLSARDVLPVTVDGYTRVFDQLPSWRKGAGRHAAVLDARVDPERRMNAVLLLDVAGDPAPVDDRERGYVRRRLAEDSIVRHGEGPPIGPVGFPYIYVGRPDLRGRDVLPNRDYLRICLEGAREWGEAFYEDFLRTTFLCEGETLAAYVAPAGSGRQA